MGYITYKYNFCDVCGNAVTSGFKIGKAFICSHCKGSVTDKVARQRLLGTEPRTEAFAIARNIFREKYRFGDYLLRDIPKSLWVRVKHRAADEGIPMRKLILRAIHEYCEPET